MTEQNILIVDGFGDCALTAAQVFSPQDFTIINASTVEDGQRLLARHQSELIITDCLVSPTPLIWVEEAHRLGLNSQVIAVTQEENYNQTVDWMAKGIYNILNRPLDPDHLLQLSLEALGNQTVIREVRNQPLEKNLADLANPEASLTDFYRGLIGLLDPKALVRHIVDSIKKLTGANQVQLRKPGAGLPNSPKNHWQVYELTHDRHRYGELWLRFDHTHQPQLTPEPMKQVTAAISIAFTAVHDFREAVDQGSKDCLTGLYNRRVFNEGLEVEFSKAHRHNLSLSLIMLDLDHFKKVNDNYGHQTGDLVLQDTARLMGQVTRSSDLTARVGGEEFTMLLPHTSLEEAQEVAGRLQTRMRQHAFNFNGTIFHQTISQGVVDLEHFLVKNPGDMVYWADQALYLAKREGRDTIRTATDIPMAPVMEDGLHIFQ